MKNLRNETMSDRALLLAIDAVRDKQYGTALAQDVAEYLGIHTNGKRTPAGTVSARFSWLRRNKLIERVDARAYGGKASDPPKWVITKEGEQLMKGKLGSRFEREIDNLNPGGQAVALSHLAQRAYVDADPWVATAIRRQWLHDAARRVGR